MDSQQRPCSLQLVGAATEHFHLPDPAFAEKDYWVVEVLRSLVRPIAVQPINGQDASAQVVFKGGTSLSKAFGLIERFSEDVDILVVCSPNMGQASRENRVLRPLCERVAADLELDADSFRRGSYKTGFTRNATYLYPANNVSASLRTGVLLEMGIRGGTQPGLLEANVSSFITEYLKATGQHVDFADCTPVGVTVLHPARTTIEKLSLLHHAAVEALKGDTASLRQAARHYYDLHHLLAHGPVLQALDNGAVTQIAEDVSENSKRYGWPFTPRPSTGYAQSPAFESDSQITQAARSAYDDVVANLVYGDAPSFHECLAGIRAAHAVI